MPPREAEPPWHAHLTVDLLANVLQRSVFHPFIAWLVPLCLRALGHALRSRAVVATSAWAAAVTVLAALLAADRAYASGPPRELDWAKEVIVVTGGASGLGRVLARMYAMRGASVAVLDVRLPGDGGTRGGGGEETEGKEAEEEEENVRFYRCDVGDLAAVESVRVRIEQDLGPPTILINNAGLVHGKSFLALTPDEIARTIQTNLCGPIHVLKTFLPPMLSAIARDRIPGGTLVTVASVLGKLGAARLSDYTATKGALIALHRSLAAELAAGGEDAEKRVRCVLVTPGQLATGMFAGVCTPRAFWGPVVEPVELAREVVRAIDEGWAGEVSLPLYARWIEALTVLPPGLQRVMRRWSGVDEAMEGFVGREGRREKGD